MLNLSPSRPKWPTVKQQNASLGTCPHTKAFLCLLWSWSSVWRKIKGHILSVQLPQVTTQFLLILMPTWKECIFYSPLGMMHCKTLSEFDKNIWWSYWWLTLSASPDICLGQTGIDSGCCLTGWCYNYRINIVSVVGPWRKCPEGSFAWTLIAGYGRVVRQLGHVYFS